MLLSNTTHRTWHSAVTHHILITFHRRFQCYLICHKLCQRDIVYGMTTVMEQDWIPGSRVKSAKKEFLGNFLLLSLLYMAMNESLLFLTSSLVNVAEVGRLTMFSAPLILDCGGGGRYPGHDSQGYPVSNLSCHRSSSFTSQEKPRVMMFHLPSDMECKVFYAGVIWAGWSTFLLLSLANTMYTVLPDVLQC